MVRTLSVRSLVVAAAFTVAPLVALAGPLTPPAGEPGSTMKTLVQVEPRIAVNAANTPGDAGSVFRITQPGSYYLTDDVVGVAGKQGIKIEASEVTLDLSGMAVRGIPGATIGISITGHNVVIRNGLVSSWSSQGILAPEATHVTLREVRLVNNKSMGANLGAYAAVYDSEAAGNGSTGFQFLAAGIAANCRAESNNGFGFNFLNGGHMITSCTALLNGDDGFNINGASVITGSSSLSNGGNGFTALGSTLNGCLADTNGDHGYWITDYSTVTLCQAKGNLDTGFFVGVGSVARECTAFKNGHGGGFYTAGFYLSEHARVTSSHAVGNGQGIYVPSSCNAFLAGNTAVGNTTAQITVGLGNDTGVILTNPGTGFTSTNPFANIAP